MTGLEDNIRTTIPTFKKKDGQVIPGTEHHYDELELILGKIYFSMTPLKLSSDLDRLDFKFASQSLTDIAVVYSLYLPEEIVDRYRRRGALGKLTADCKTVYDLADSLTDYVPFDASREKLITSIQENIEIVRSSLMNVLERHEVISVGFDEHARVIRVFEWHQPDLYFADLGFYSGDSD